MAISCDPCPLLALCDMICSRNSGMNLFAGTCKKPHFSSRSGFLDQRQGRRRALSVCHPSNRGPSIIGAKVQRRAPSDRVTGQFKVDGAQGRRWPMAAQPGIQHLNSVARRKPSTMAAHPSVIALVIAVIVPLGWVAYDIWLGPHDIHAPPRSPRSTRDSTAETVTADHGSRLRA